MNSVRLPTGRSSESGRTKRPDADHERRRTTLHAPTQLRKVVSTVSFWGAIALPALYLPLLLQALESAGGLGLFLGLVGLHVLALFGGRRHHG